MGAILGGTAMSHISVLHMPVLLLLASLWALISFPASAESPAVPAHFSPDQSLDQWIRSRLREVPGEAATEQQEGESLRVMPARILLSLLTDAQEKLPRRGTTFVRTRIHGDLDARNIRLAKPIRFHRCVFEGQPNFSGSIFESGVCFTHCTFEKGIWLLGTTFECELILDNSVFNDEVIMHHASIGRDFYAHDVSFGGTPGALTLSEASISGSAFLTGSTVMGELDAEGLNVGGALVFKDGFFHGPLEMAFVTIGRNLELSRSVFYKSSPHRLVRMDVGGSLQGFRARVGDPMHLDFSSIAGNLNLAGATFLDTLSLRHVKVADTAILPIEFPIKDLFLHGLVFAGLQGTSDTTNADPAMASLERAEFSPQIYAAYAACFRRTGCEPYARKILVAMNWRLAREMLWSLESIGLYILGFLYGFGYEKKRILVWIALWIVAGSRVFRKSRMTRSDSQNASPPYSPLLYSLETFLPFMDLGLARFWVPSSNSPVARRYLRCHVIFGWILIPLGLAALIGLLGPHYGGL